MNRKLEALTILVARAIGRRKAIDSVGLSELGDFTVPEASVYLRLLWREKSIAREKAGLRLTRTRHKRPTYLYWIEPSANVAQILKRSEEISGRGRFRAPVQPFSAAALAGCWR